MPSIISHPAVVFALGPVFARLGVAPRLWLVGAVCTVVPDLDSIGFFLGVRYASLLGHRGLSHSLLFALTLALALAPLCRRLSPRASLLAVAGFLFLCTASHGALDALTSGGLGVAFLSPFDQHRHFFPWRPIAVSPLSVSRFLAGRGVRVLVSELKWVVLPSLLTGIAAHLLLSRSGAKEATSPRGSRS
uniref:Inner membrane protein n=1 Tax=Aetherobacter rufus TaxID=888831 RepID=A0A3Q8I230_9BACT|nr:inner membrane protein [Aetherobacter rufus]